MEIGSLLKTFMCIVAFAVACNAAAESTHRGGVRVTCDVEPSRPRVAEPITLRVTAEAPQPIEIEFPDLGPSFGSLRVTASGNVIRLRGETSIVWQKLYTLESDRSGAMTLPPIEVRVSETETIVTEPLHLEVVSSLPIEQQEGNVKAEWIGPLEPPQTIQTDPVATYAWVWGGLVLSCVVAVLAGLVWRKVRKARQPNTRMIQRLNELTSVARNQPTEAAIGLIEAWRVYLADRWSIATAGMTSLELADAAADRLSLDPSSIDVIRRCGQTAERVAYAGETVSIDEVSRSISESQSWVRQMNNRKPVIAPERRV